MASRLDSFAPYLSHKYALVVAWISSRQELIEKFAQRERLEPKWPSLYVEFPAERPFYPMRPTSGYGTKPVSVSLYLLGFMDPDTSSWTSSEKKHMFPRVKYFAGERRQFGRAYRAYLSSQEKQAAATAGKEASSEQRKVVEGLLAALPEREVLFTRVRISRPADNFTRDLWFSPNTLAYLKHSIVSSPWVAVSLGVLVVAVLSYVSAGISGRIVFEAWRPWARVGLWNCFTVAALVAATWLRRRTEPRGQAATASPRREWLTFCAFVWWPLIVLVTSLFRPIDPVRHGVILPVLMYILSAAVLLIAGWIVSNPGAVATNVGRGDSGGRSFARIMLVLALGGLLILATTFGLLYGLEGIVWVLILAIQKLGWPIVASVLITAGLFIVSRIIRKVRSAWVGRATVREGEAALGSCRNPEVLILGALTCIVMASVVALNPWAQGFLLRIGVRGLIAAELLIAAWLLGKGESASLSMEDPLSPRWPVVLAGVLPLLALCGLAAYLAAHSWGRESVYYLSGWRPFALVAFVGATIIVGLVTVKPINGPARGMTYGRGLSSLFVILAVLSYLAALEQFGSVLAHAGYLGDSLAALALICGTWLLKGVLQDVPTKALRFGILFSIVFTILTFAVFVWLRWVLEAI